MMSLKNISSLILNIKNVNTEKEHTQQLRKHSTMTTGVLPHRMEDTGPGRQEVALRSPITVTRLYPHRFQEVST